MKAIAGGNDECRLHSYLSELGGYAASSQLCYEGALPHYLFRTGTGYMQAVEAGNDKWRFQNSRS